MKLIALFFALTAGVFAQKAAVPFNEPLERDGTTVELQPSGNTLTVRVAPADARALQLGVEVAVETAQGVVVCSVTGPADPAAAFTTFDLPVGAAPLKALGLKVSLERALIWGSGGVFAPPAASTCAPGDTTTRRR